VLIDADHAQAAIAQGLLAEIARYGTATVKRAHGDWTTQNPVGWKETLHSLAIQPRQFRFTVGTNATDSALIIEAMDLPHSGSLDGFCLVSSDTISRAWPRASARPGWRYMDSGRERRPSRSLRPATSSCSPRFCANPCRTEKTGRTRRPSRFAQGCGPR
jgi:hypothetical protein